MFKRIKDPYKAAELVQEILMRINLLNDPPLNEVLKLSLSKGLTFYGANYVYAAENIGITLVTEDQQILKSTNNAISFREFINIVLRSGT